MSLLQRMSWELPLKPAAQSARETWPSPANISTNWTFSVCGTREFPANKTINSTRTTGDFHLKSSSTTMAATGIAKTRKTKRFHICFFGTKVHFESFAAQIFASDSYPEALRQMFLTYVALDFCSSTEPLQPPGIHHIWVPPTALSQIWSIKYKRNTYYIKQLQFCIPYGTISDISFFIYPHTFV